MGVFSKFEKNKHVDIIRVSAETIEQEYGLLF